MKVILDLCSGTGAWSRPYEENGYRVVHVDLANGEDVRLHQKNGSGVYGILAAPPCTHLSSSGARWWADKGDEALLQSLSVVDACLRLVAVYRPAWWALENPVGRLSRYLGKPAMYFQPWEYGDPYTKRTCLWGKFNVPKQSPVEPTDGGKMWMMSPSSDRAAKRSITPSGFARAFAEANP